MPSLDRFSHAVTDESEPELIAVCDSCGEEIFEGDDICMIDDACYCSAECTIEGLGIEKKKASFEAIGA